MRPMPLLILLTGWPASPAMSQVPLGSYVVSSTWVGPLGAGPGGLFLVDPRVPGPPVALTGLPAELIGQATQASLGASAIAIRMADGALVAGAVTTLGNPVELHTIELAGAAVINHVRTPIGVAGNGNNAGIVELDLLPNGDALIAVQSLQNTPPLQGEMLAIVSRTGVVTPVPTPILQAPYPLALAVDPTGSTAYLVVGPLQPHAVHLYAVPLPAGGTAQLIGTLAPGLAGIYGLAFAPNGDLLASTPTELYRIDLTAGTAAPIANLPVGGSASLAIEGATSNRVVIGNTFAPAGTAVHVMTPNNAATLLTTGITGVLSDVAVHANPHTFGSATSGDARYDWQVAPAPGGLPRAGNGGFGLQTTAELLSPSGTLQPGFVFGALSPGSVVLTGATVLVDPATALLLGLAPSQAPLPLALPGTAPIGLRIYAQSFHLDPGAPGGVSATPGQRFEIMR